MRNGWDVIALVPPGEAEAAKLRFEQPVGPDAKGKVHLVAGTLGEIEQWQGQMGPLAPAACIHLAWATTPGSYLDTLENLSWLSWTNDLFARLPDWGVKHIVGVGSCAEYDADYGYLREETPTRPLTLYAASKLAARSVGQQLAARAGVQFSWARIFHLYGPGEHPRRLVAACMQSLLAQERFEATEGRQVRDFLHVDDVGAGIIKVLEANRGEDANVCSGEPVTVRHILEVIASCTGRSDLLALGARKSPAWDPPFLCGDSQRLRSYGWRPKFSLKGGIADAVSWWREQT